jgi:hypothetical protein
MVDEQLHGRTWFTAFQSYDTDRSTGNRQFDRQFSDEWMSAGKLEPEFRQDRKITARAQKIGSHFER